MGGKLGRLLEEQLKRLTSEDPASPIDLVIKTRSGDDVETVLQELQSLGGSATEVGDEGIYCRVPSGQVRKLADSDAVAEIRPSRTHRMH
jgi:hypothetical protein